MRKSVLLVLAACLGVEPMIAAEWTWDWKPAKGEDKVPQVEICPFKYGKRWAYAVEIDDGPKWIATFAARFLAEYHFTDAPPGEAGGRSRPFVGSAAVIVGATGNNETALNWDDLKMLCDAGWRVMNHSYDHRANDWSGEASRLNDSQALVDAYWSQTLLWPSGCRAAVLPRVRSMPTATLITTAIMRWSCMDS